MYKMKLPVTGTSYQMVKNKQRLKEFSIIIMFCVERNVVVKQVKINGSVVFYIYTPGNS